MLETHTRQARTAGLIRDEASETIVKLSAILIVHNEAQRVAKCLRSLRPIVDEIIVLDSGSTDQTVAIARSFGARVEVTDWPGFGPQKNRALDRAHGEWILAIDADEHLTPELARSIRAAVDAAPTDVNGCLIRFCPTWCGKAVRFGDWGGKRHLRLFRRVVGRFTDDAVHERVVCLGPHLALDGSMIHDTIVTDEQARRKALLYAELRARPLAAQGRGGAASALMHAGWAWLRGFVLKAGFLDGVVGWKVARAIAHGTWLRYYLAGQMRRAASRQTERWHADAGPPQGRSH